MCVDTRTDVVIEMASYEDYCLGSSSINHFINKGIKSSCYFYLEFPGKGRVGSPIYVEVQLKNVYFFDFLTISPGTST